MLMQWTDSMVTCWRLIKRPWVGKKITFANIDKKNERTKKKTTKVNVNYSHPRLHWLCPRNKLGLFAYRGVIISTTIEFLSSVNKRFPPTKQ